MRPYLTEWDVRDLWRRGERAIDLSRYRMTDLAAEAATRLGLALVDSPVAVAPQAHAAAPGTVVPPSPPARRAGAPPSPPCRPAVSPPCPPPRTVETGFHAHAASLAMDVRALFPTLRHLTYLASNSHGLLSTRVEGALARYLASWREWGDPWETEWLPAVDRSAEAFARLIGGDPESVGVVGSLSDALGAVLSALDFRERRKVIVSRLDFPTVADILIAYREQGLIELDVLPESQGDVPVSLYRQAIDEDTALVCVSQVSYLTGSRLPVAEVVEAAHRRGAAVFVDAYQGLGAVTLRVDEVPCDFLAAGALKFLLGVPGVAFLYARPDVAPGLRPLQTGWMGQARPFFVNWDMLEYAAGGRRFQAGTFTVPACYAAEAGIGLILELGPERIAARVRELARAFAAGLGEMGLSPYGPATEDRIGPTVCLPWDDAASAQAARQALQAEHRIVTTAREHVVRFSFHFYNSLEDVDRALVAVRALHPRAA